METTESPAGALRLEGREVENHAPLPSTPSKPVIFMALALLIGVLAFLCAQYHVSTLENTLEGSASDR